MCKQIRVMAISDWREVAVEGAERQAVSAAFSVASMASLSAIFSQSRCEADEEARNSDSRLMAI